MIGSNVIINQDKISDNFNNYFLSIANPKNTDFNKQINISMTKPINYLADSFRGPFTRINWQCTSSYEIGKIIKSSSTKKYNWVG